MTMVNSVLSYFDMKELFSAFLAVNHACKMVYVKIVVIFTDVI